MDSKKYKFEILGYVCKLQYKVYTVETLRHLYWGKLGSDGQWQHLCHHCLDVAACVDGLLDSNPRWAKELYALSPYSEENTRKLILFFAAIHD